jgi:hypothetical protein
MTSLAAFPTAPLLTGRPPETVSVVVTGRETPTGAALRTAVPMGWTVADATIGDDLPADDRVDIVVCPAADVLAARRRWPAAAVVAVARRYEASSSAIAALGDGADVCVGDPHPRVVTAFLLAVARRRGLVDRGDRR